MAKIILASGGFIYRPSVNTDRERINRMSVKTLKNYIWRLKSYGLTSSEIRDCYEYAKARLPIAIKEQKERERLKEIQKQKKKEAKEIQKQKNEKAKERQKELREAKKSQEREALKKRKTELTMVGNSKIKEMILAEFEQKWERMPEENRSKKIDRKKSALSNIDFVNGKIRPSGYDFMTVHLTYLTDKGVILLRGLYNGIHIFYSPNGDSSYLTTVLGLTQKEKKDNSINKKAYLRELSKSSQTMLGEPTVCRFTFDYFKDMASKYYLYYEERESKGTEETNIPCFL